MLPALAYADFFLANPLGLWGLLGIPAILAIHFLQTKARHIVVSTLFLIEALDKESLGGRRFERLRNSVPLWLQILAVLLLTWILCQPRWIRKESVQAVVVLLDASLSMDAFRSTLVQRIQAPLSKLAGAAATTAWTVVDTDSSRKPIYNGNELHAALESLASWRPRLGGHDFGKAFSLSRALAGPSGIVVFVTDRPIPVPEGTSILSVGEPLENRGFAGLRVTSNQWDASLRNYGKENVTTEWKLIGPGNAEMKKEQVLIGPGETKTISGEFQANSLRLEIEPDGFTLDNTLPIVRPVGKILKVRAATGISLYEELLKLEPGLRPEPDLTQPVDLVLGIYDPLAPSMLKENAILSVKEPSKEGKTEQGEIVAVRDPLTDDLSWQGLTIRDSLQAPPKPGDRVLVWQGERALIYLRTVQQNQQLVINFDIDQSNARRVPAFIVLLHRFLALVRERTPGFEVANFESNQRIPLAFRPPGNDLKLDLNLLAAGEETSGSLSKADAEVLRAPMEPAILQLSQSGDILLQGAAHFSDVREADFSQAAPLDRVSELAGRLVEQRSEEDFLAPVWALLLGAVLLGNYAWLGRRK